MYNNKRISIVYKIVHTKASAKEYKMYSSSSSIVRKLAFYLYSILCSMTGYLVGPAMFVSFSLEILGQPALLFEFSYFARIRQSILKPAIFFLFL